MYEFRDDPDHGNSRIWRKSRKGFVASALLAVFCGLIFLFLLVCAVGAVFAEFSPVAKLITATIVALLAWLFGGLAWYCWRDARGKLGGEIRIDDGGIALDLKQDRSLVHHSPSLHAQFQWRDVEGFNTRLEGYRSQGLGMMQRSYWIKPRDRAPILLFEDRGIDTNYVTPSYENLFNEIARRAGKTPVELPLAEGRGGIFGAWFTRPPPIETAELPEAAKRRLRRGVALTAILPGFALLVVIISMVLS